MIKTNGRIILSAHLISMGQKKDVGVDQGYTDEGLSASLFLFFFFYPVISFPLL